MGGVVGAHLHHSSEQGCECLQLHALLGVGEQILRGVRFVSASVHQSIASDAVVDGESHIGHHILGHRGGLLCLECGVDEISGEVEIGAGEPDLGVQSSTQQT